MDIHEISALVSAMPGVFTLIPEEGGDTPAIAWGDTFFLYDPSGHAEGSTRQPFATIVVKDYPGWDEASNLDRPDVFRLNISVGRTRFTELLGYAPKRHAEHHDGIDYTVTDRLLPHPIYAQLGWVSILNLGPRTSELARDLLRRAYDLDVARYHRRSAQPDQTS